MEKDEKIIVSGLVLFLILAVVFLKSCYTPHDKVIERKFEVTKIKVLKFSPPTSMTFNYQIVSTGEVVEYWIKNCVPYISTLDNIVPNETYNIVISYTTYQRTDHTTYKVREDGCELMRQLPFAPAA